MYKVPKIVYEIKVRQNISNSCLSDRIRENVYITQG